MGSLTANASKSVPSIIIYSLTVVLIEEQSILLRRVPVAIRHLRHAVGMEEPIAIRDAGIEVVKEQGIIL